MLAWYDLSFLNPQDLSHVVGHTSGGWREKRHESRGLDDSMWMGLGIGPKDLYPWSYGKLKEDIKQLITREPFLREEATFAA